MSGLDRLLEYGYRRFLLLRRWRELVGRLKEVVVRLLGPDTRVCVFGSVVEGVFTAASDIDVLVVSPRVPEDGLERARLIVRIEEELGFGPLDPNPLEIHLVTPEEAEWYFKYLRIKCVEV